MTRYPTYGLDPPTERVIIIYIADGAETKKDDMSLPSYRQIEATINLDHLKSSLFLSATYFLIFS